MGITYELIPLNNDEFSEAEEILSNELVAAIAEGNISPSSPFMKLHPMFENNQSAKLAFYKKFKQRKIEVIDDSTKAKIHVSPLHFAVIQGHLNLCTSLCDPSVNAMLEVVGSDTNTTAKIRGISYTHGFTALHIATVHGRTHSEIKEYLLKQGANPKATDVNGNTPEEVTPLQWSENDEDGKSENASNRSLKINHYYVAEEAELQRPGDDEDGKSENAVDDTQEDATSKAQQFILANNIAGLRDHLFALEPQSQVSMLLLTAFARKITNGSEKTLAECMEETFESGDSRMFYFIYDEFFQSKPLDLLTILLQSKAYKLAEEVLLLHERNNETVTVKDLLDRNDTLMDEFAKDPKAIALINKYKGDVVAQPATPLQKTLNALNAFRIQVSENNNDQFAAIPFGNAHLATLMVDLRVFDKSLAKYKGYYPNDLVTKTHTLVNNVINSDNTTSSEEKAVQISEYMTYVNSLKDTCSPNGKAKWDVFYGFLVVLVCALVDAIIGVFAGGPPGAVIGAFEGLETGFATAGSMAITVGATATTAACIYGGYRMVASYNANVANRDMCKNVASSLTEVNKLLETKTRGAGIYGC